MKTFCYAFTMMLVVAFAGPALADKSFDICINPATDVVLDDIGPSGLSAGDGFVAVAIIVPGGTIPTDGIGVASCSTIAGARIGTFFAKGRIVLGLPKREPDDLAYVDWQFRIDGRGSIDTSGPVKIVPALGTYPQTIVGATGNGLGSGKGAATVKTLTTDGFQFRLIIP